MLEIVLKGIIIGVLVSAPMGPTGILCVQRTLNRGRWHGFVTGLGATLSDVLYASITLLGVSLITDFLEKNEVLLQVAGSAVLIVFGYAVYRTNPLKSLKPNEPLPETRYTKDFISSFFLTASNVIIIFVFFTLYARFSVNPSDGGLWGHIVSIAAIASGAVAWWFFITAFVSYLRKHFNRKGLVLLNRIIGIVLIAIGIVGVVTGFLAVY
ncbi:MAG: LysE family transporter [Dysgonamonadaceae bacterium]|jgi:threonine/homoserine/homoserine lactone efflux protein|nr:LysE family transporter [Dysgonamonadaceae bacterium]